MRRTTRAGMFALCAALLLSCKLLAPASTETPVPTDTPTATVVPMPTPEPTPTTTPTPTSTSTLGPTDTPALPAAPTTEPMPENPSLDYTWTRPGGAVMAYVPAGEFTMGSTDEEMDQALVLCVGYLADCERGFYEDEQPAHTVVLDAYWIDRTEVTNGQYQQCVAVGACEPPVESGSTIRDSYYGHSGYDDYPVIYVDWHQAADYCEWAGARLPTEAEWEYAARGPEGRLFPWGDELDGTRLNYCDANCVLDWADESFDDGYFDTAPVGSYPAGASWCGALDMAGNVWEWTADWHGEYPSGRQANPTGPPSGTHRVARGGAWLYGLDHARCSFRLYLHPRHSYGDFGFRCVAPVGSGS